MKGKSEFKAEWVKRSLADMTIQSPIQPPTVEVLDVVTIPRENYDEYQKLLNARDFICEDINDGRDITIPYLLKRLGGYKASMLYEKFAKEIREDKDEREDREQQD